MIRTNVFFCFGILVSVALFSCTKAPSPLVSLGGQTMGTSYSVKYVNPEGRSSSISATQMQESIDTLLIEINQLMSTYIPDSELSMLNKAQENLAFNISPETNFVIQEALALHDKSNGMLDITVGPLVNSWGFGPTSRANKIPTSAQLNDIMQYVGVDKFSLSNMQVTKSHPLVYIDLSTIAKGYAVDRIAQLLQSNNLTNYLVEIGGEMRASGTKPNNVNWLIAIEKPLSGTRAVQRIVSIGDNAIASSGDYRNYFEEDGVRYSHLIDPTTGYPIQHNLVAVTVVAQTSMEADAMATALMVMGLEPGKKVAQDNDLAALFITKEGDKYVEYQTPMFSQTVQIIE